MENDYSAKGRLIPLFLVIFIDSVAYFLVIPVFLRLFLHGNYHLIPDSLPLSMRNLLYGITVTLLPLAFLLTAPLIGHFSDKHGRRFTILLCLITSFVGFILPVFGIFSGSLVLVLIGRFITGAASSSQPVAQAAIADFTQGKQKAFYLSLIGFAMTLAMVLGSIGGGYLSDEKLVHWFNVMTPYWVGVILSILNIILLLVFYRQFPKEQQRTHVISTREVIKILFEIILRSNVSRLLFVFFLLEFAWSQYFQVIFLYLSERYHYSPTLVSLYIGYIGFWMSLGLTLIYRIAVHYLSIEKIISISMPLLLLGFIGCTVFSGTTAQWLFVILIAMFTGMAYASLLALISNQAHPQHQGWIMGVASTLLASAWMITAFLSGWLINIYFQLPFMLATVAMIIGCLILFLQPRRVG